MGILKKVLAATAAAALMTGASAAGLDGQSLTYEYVFAWSTPPVLETSTFVVGSGVEVENMLDYLGSIDVSNDQIVITFLPYESTFTESTYNGIRLTSTNLPAFGNVTVDAATTTAGFSSSFISYTDNVLSINWQGMYFDTGNTIVLDITSGVPEAGNAAMLLAGLAMSAALARRRRAD